SAARRPAAYWPDFTSSRQSGGAAACAGAGASCGRAGAGSSVPRGASAGGGAAAVVGAGTRAATAAGRAVGCAAVAGGAPDSRRLCPAPTARGPGRQAPETPTVPSLRSSANVWSLALQPTRNLVPLTTTWKGPASKRQLVFG